jgi:quinol monooxygenase YgiN
MIVRIVSARVPAQNAYAFEELMRRQLPRMRDHDGLVYVKLARQAHRGYEDVLLFEEWRDAAALHAWAGPELHRPRLLPGAELLAENVEVTHYEALDVEPDALVAVPPPAEPLPGAQAGSSSSS